MSQSGRRRCPGPTSPSRALRSVSEGDSTTLSSLQLIIDTPTSPVTSGLPLFFVITVTAIKQVSFGDAGGEEEGPTECLLWGVTCQPKQSLLACFSQFMGRSTHL